MTTLEYLIIAFYASCIIFLLFSILNFVLIIKNNKKLKTTKKQKNRSRAEKKKNKNKIISLKKAKRKSIWLSIICSLLAISSGAGASYASYYQSINLTTQDSENIVEAYYLITDIEKQLELASTSQESSEKVSDAIRKYAGQMASFNSRRASDLNKEDGQVLLNRYYNLVKEIGINASTQPQEFYGNPDLTSEFSNDIKRVKTYQKDVFAYYKVNEEELKQNE